MSVGSWDTAAARRVQRLGRAISARRETSHVPFRRSPILLRSITGNFYPVSVNSGHITLLDDNAVLGIPSREQDAEQPPSDPALAILSSCVNPAHIQLTSNRVSNPCTAPEPRVRG